MLTVKQNVWLSQPGLHPTQWCPSWHSHLRVGAWYSLAAQWALLLNLNHKISIVYTCAKRSISPGGRRQAVRSMGKVLPIPVGRQLRMWRLSSWSMAAAVMSACTCRLSMIIFSKWQSNVKSLAATVYLEVAQIWVQGWVGQSKLSILVFNCGPSL